MASARLSMSMMFLAVAGLMVPALFHFTSPTAEREISLQIAAILLVVYVLSLVYTLFTHRKLFDVAKAAELEAVKTHSWKTAVAVLAVATVVLAAMSEILTDALDPAMKQLGINEVFAGVILLASVSNISSIMNAVVFAQKDQMDLAASSVIGAATQIALLVAPALVFASLLMPRVDGSSFQPSRAGRAHHLGLHCAEHDHRRQVRLARGCDADRRFRHARGRILLRRLNRRNEPIAHRRSPVPSAFGRIGLEPIKSVLDTLDNLF